ncbi:PAS domain-containing protein, partial [Arcanobacterium sp. S3PF19]|uniref:PAS domain-containing protein n=1 Tax=Arcanobacterium sp. S3PF19 TaxID=1219585 RepID=UPI0005103957
MEKKSPNRLKRTSDDEREARIILRTLSSIIEPLHATLPGPNEVLLHDLSLLPNSIVKISGSITGRTAGGVATNTLLRDAANNTLETKFNYLTKAA